MITTLTVNPAVDKTFFIDDFRTNQLNRASKVQFDAGSKGVNISRVMKTLDVDTITTGFSGGYGGEILKGELDREGVAYDFVETKASVRINTKVADVTNGTFTDINEPGGEISDEELFELFQKIDALAKRSDIFTMGGSIQTNLPADLYKQILTELNRSSVLTGLDCGGELLRRGLEAKPYFIKPNELELSLYTGKTIQNLQDVISAAAQIQKSGVAYVLVSLGENGSVCVCDDGAFRVEPISVHALGTAGAGDSYFSGFLYGFLQKKGVEESLRYASSFSTAKVLEEGTVIPPRKGLFRFVDQVIIRRI